MRRLAAAAIALCAAPFAHGSVIYVDALAGGANNGSSWLNAYTDLEAALAAASAGDEVWIADGTYNPPGQTAPFALPSGVKLYGGFAGGETSIDQRDPGANLTILDGDLNGDDQPGFVNRLDNAHTVISASSPALGTRLDGLVVRGGYTPASIPNSGGGLLVIGGHLNIVGCLFVDNGAAGGGGAAYFLTCDEVRISDTVFTFNATNPNAASGAGGAIVASHSPMHLERCTFAFNAALATDIASGGAIFYADEVSTITDCQFIGNSAQSANTAQGGAVDVVYGSVDFLRTRFVQNAAIAPSAFGGALFLGSITGDIDRFVACEFLGNQSGWGGAICALLDVPLRVAASVFSGNTAERGAALYVDSDLRLDNSTIAFNTNTVRTEGAGVTNTSATPTRMSNTIVWGNDAAGSTDQAAQIDGAVPPIISYSCVQGWDGSLGGAGNIGLDPSFLDPAGPDGAIGTADDRYELGPFSPCIDAGSNPAIPIDLLDLDADGITAEPLPLDVYLQARRYDDVDVADTGLGVVPLVDIGAAESQSRSCPGDFNGDGSVNTLDVIGFLNAWAAGDGSADVNMDGSVNTLDVLLFLNQWAAGC